MHPNDLPPDFFSTHFPDCDNNTDFDAICTCDEIERDLRDAFAEMTRECY